MIKKIFLILTIAIFALSTLAFAQFTLNLSEVHGSGLADSPWPVFGHDSRHTGLSPYSIGKEKKDLLWSYKVGAGIESSSVIGKDGTIYFGSHDGSFYAINKDGSLKWKKELTKPVYDERWNVSKAIMASPAIASDGTVYINTASGYLHALDPSGSEKWRFPIKWHNDFWNGPNIGPDGTIYIGTARYEEKESGAGLVAITPEGKEKWRSLESSGVTIVPAVSSDGTIISGAADPKTNRGKIISLNPDGTKKWEFVLKEWLEGPAAIGSDGTIFSGSKEGDFYAITQEGSEKWHFKTGGGISAMPTIGSDGNVYIGSWDGNFYAFDQKTGQEKWRFDVKVGRNPKLFEGYPGKETIITSAALSKDGVLIFADVFDTVYAVDTSGKELWRWKNNSGSGFVPSAAIGEDGTVYIACGDGNLYALGEKKNAQIETSSSAGKQDKNTKSPSNITIYFLAAAVFAVILAGAALALYLKRKRGLIILIALIILATAGALVYLFYPKEQKIQTQEVKPTSTQTETEERKDESQNQDEFTKNATRISGPVEIWVRDFGEVARSCAGAGCGSTKDTCIRWNKTKDNCYEMTKTMPASSDRYKIYCNLVIVNQDQAKSASVSLNLNYTTADGTEHLVKKESLDLKQQTGQSLSWAYEVEAKNIGQCGYSDIATKEAE